MKKYLLILLSSSLLSCRVGTSGTWVNANIEPDIKSKIDQLNKTLYNDIQKKDATGLKQLMSPGLIEKSGKLIDSLSQPGRVVKRNQL